MNTPFEGYEDAVCSAVPLATVTSFRIGGPAEYFIEPRSFEELAALLNRCSKSGVRTRVIGKGSNLLVSDRGVSGAVFRLSKMKDITHDGSRVICDAGASLSRLLHVAEEWGLSGLEPLAGIPGTVGGAVAMNAGGRHGAIASVLRSVTTFTQHGSVHERTPEELGLSYRHSSLRGEVVLRAEFDLVEREPAEIAETRITVLEDKARTQPLVSWSAGCIFKNLGQCSAGELIDLAGLKGERVGQAVVSAKHANFIINDGGATAQDVQTLIAKLKKGVSKTFGIELELEIEQWN